MNYLLQQKTISTGTDLLLQYGVLGLFALIMLYVIVYFEKQRRKGIETMQQEMAALKQRMLDQQKSHEDFIRKEFAESVEVNRKCIDVMEEVKEMLLRINK